MWSKDLSHPWERRLYAFNTAGSERRESRQFLLTKVRPSRGRREAGSTCIVGGRVYRKKRQCLLTALSSSMKLTSEK